MATIKDVAQSAQVSATTVSRVLNRDDNMSVTPEVRMRIFQAAHALGYVSPRQRRAAAEKTKLIIGVADWRIIRPDRPNIRLSSLSCLVQMMTDQYDVSFIRLVFGQPQPVDGVIAFGAFTAPEMDFLRSLSFAIVFVNSDQHNYEFDQIQVDFDQGLKQMAAYLLDKKQYRGIGYIGGVYEHGGVRIGGQEKIAMIAGPCSVEGLEPIVETAKAVKAAGATMLRGGAYKPRTSPYSFQGMRSEGLDLLKLARRATGSPIVTEIMNTEHVPLFADVDMIQVGARNMQNFELLKELGKLQTPVLLKRGLANTIEEFLMSAEYIMAGGNENVVLCERGIRTFETSMRNTLDISAVPMLKSKTHLPVVIDPSHAAGIAWMVEPLAMAAIAAGADGLMIEVHNDPPHAKSDGAQSLTPAQFDALMGKVKAASAFFGKAIN